MKNIQSLHSEDKIFMRRILSIMILGVALIMGWSCFNGAVDIQTPISLIVMSFIGLMMWIYKSETKTETKTEYIAKPLQSEWTRSYLTMWSEQEILESELLMEENTPCPECGEHANPRGGTCAPCNRMLIEGSMEELEYAPYENENIIWSD